MLDRNTEAFTRESQLKLINNGFIKSFYLQLMQMLKKKKVTAINYQQVFFKAQTKS